MNCIITLAGPSKSGKTTLAKKLAASLGVPFTSFGEYVRKEAQRRSMASVTARQLQDLGMELVKRDISGLCKAVFEGGGFVPGKGFVVDGIRHMDVLATIKDFAPHQSVKLVYLDCSLADRAKRSSLSARELQEIDSHPVESDGALLKSAADLVVLSTSSGSEECCESVVRWTLQNCN